MTTLRLVVEAGAATEIDKATRWYEQKGADVAAALAREIRRIFEDLVQRPPTRSLVAPGIAPSSVRQGMDARPNGPRLLVS